MYALSVFSVVLLAGQAAASAIVSRSTLSRLLSRQTTGFDPSDIPAQCQSACATAVNALNSCADVSCLCSESTNRGLYSCLECALSISPSASLLDQAQSTIEEYEQSCSQVGISVTPLTLTLPSGQTPTTNTDGSNGSGSSATVTSPGANPTTTQASAPTTTSGNGGDVSNPLGDNGSASRGNGAGSISVPGTVMAGVAVAFLAML